MRYDDPDRDRGMLAPVDRKWLLGEKEYDHRQSTHNRRNVIRERIRNTLLDFRLLLEHYDSQTDRVFHEADDELVDGMIAALGTLYLGSRPVIQYHHGYTRFEDLLTRGVARAVTKTDNRVPDPSVVNVRLDDGNIDVDLREGAVDLERIGEKIEAGETSDLDREQLSWFVDYYQRSGELDPEAPADHQRREWEALQERREERDDE